MGDIPEGGEIAVKFGLDKEGEVQIEGYMEPRHKTGFLTDELRTAYLLASTESKELQRDEQAMQLLQEYASRFNLPNNTKDTDTYEVYSVDMESLAT